MSCSRPSSTPSRAAAASRPWRPPPRRLQVVAGERLVGEGDGELVVGRGAGEDALAFGGGPAVAVERQRDPRRVADLGRGRLDRLDLELGLDLAARDRVALRQRFFEALQHRAELELAHEVPQRAAVGLATPAPPRGRPRSRCRTAASPARSTSARRRRGWSGFPCVWRRRSRRRFPAPCRACRISAAAGSRFSRRSRGRPGMLSEVSPRRPIRSVISVRRHPVALFDRGDVVDLRLGDAARGAHHPDPLADQLVGVAVAGHHHHVDPLRRGPGGRARRSRRRPRSLRPSRWCSRRPRPAASGAATARAAGRGAVCAAPCRGRRSSRGRSSRRPRRR